MRLYAAVSALIVVGSSAGSVRATAAPLRPTVTLRADFVGFYPGHLVLDGIGHAFLDDGVLHVQADRIILDMRNERYVAAGSVTVQGARGSITMHGSTSPSAANAVQGDALGIDVATHKGVLVESGQSPSSVAIDGAAVSGPAVIAPGDEPLALPDIGLENPYARASQAVAHLGADVRLRNARVIVPGGESIALPSFVYSYSSNPGYSQTNIATNGEDLPIYFGSTPNSVQGVHLSYNTVSKVALGLDSKFVGEDSYLLLSGSPLNGSTHVFNGTWQDFINEHTSQTFFSSTTTGFGTSNAYDLRDSIHQSTLELTAAGQPDFRDADFAWQGFNQYFGSGASRPYYNLRSDYGYTHLAEQASFAPFGRNVTLSNDVYHTALEGYLGSPTWNFGSNVSLNGSADLRGETDNLPHRQLAQVYTLTLFTRWTPTVSTYFSDRAAPFNDIYPSADTTYHGRAIEQILTFNYDHGDPFGLTLIGSHASAITDNPAGAVAIPWELQGTMRFRITQTLALQVGRSYFFGFEGQRYGAWSLQILP